MGNYQNKHKLNKYGRSISNELDRERKEVSVQYQGNQRMKSSVIKLNSSFSPQRNNLNMSSSMKNSKMLTSEIVSNSYIRKEGRLQIETDGQRSGSDNNMKTSSRSKSGSRMEKSFRQLKDEETKQQKIARRLIKYTNLNADQLTKLDEIKKAVDFVTHSFEFQPVDLIPLTHIASLCNLEGEAITENIEYKLINYPNHKNKQDFKLLNQMRMFQNVNQSNNQELNYIDTFGLKRSMIGEQNNDNLNGKQNFENIGLRIKEKKELVSSLKQQNNNISNQRINNQQNDFLSISQKLNNKQHELKMQANQFARPVESHIYPTPESQLRSNGQFHNHTNQQNQHNQNNESHLIYVGNPLMVSSRITHRDNYSTIQNNISNLSIDSNVKSRQYQQNTNKDIENFIKIEQQFSSTSSPQPNQNKSIASMIHERKLSQNSVHQENNPKTGQATIFNQLQKNQRINSSSKFNGENTFGGSRFRSQSEAHLPSAKNFETAVDYFDKSISNTQAFIQQKQKEQQFKQQQPQLQLQQQDANSSNKSVSKDERQILNQSELKVDSTPKFRVSLGQNNLGVSGKFGLHSHSMTSNEHQSSKGNINPIFTLNSAQIPEQPGEYIMSSQDNANQHYNKPILKEDCSTQTNNSLRYSSHLNYLTNIRKQRTTKTSSPYHRNYFEPLIIGPSESQSYSDLIKRMKNYYNKQSKFLFDSITNKNYNDYQPQSSKDHQSNNLKVKKQKKILQISSKSKQKKITTNSYANIHKQQNKKLNKEVFQNENYQEVLRNHHPLYSPSNLSNFSSNSNLQNYSSNSHLYSTKLSQNTSQNNNSKFTAHHQSPQNYKNYQQTSIKNNHQVNRTSPLIKTQIQKSPSQDKMSKSTRAHQKSLSPPAQQRSKSRKIGEYNPRSPQLSKQYNFSSNYEEDDDDQENCDINSHILNISSNTTSDIQPPIQISLGVSQFKKKSAKNSMIKDSQQIVKNQSPGVRRNNDVLTYQIINNHSNSPNQKENKKFSKSSKQIKQDNINKQLYQQKIFDNTNNFQNIHQLQESQQLKYQTQVLTNQNQEEEFVEKYINQSSRKKKSKERSTPSRKSRERSSQKLHHRQSPSSNKKKYKQKKESPNRQMQQILQYQEQFKGAHNKQNNKIFTSMGNSDIN